MDWFRSDVRPALREFRRRPWLTLVMVGTLAAGLGLNAVAFSAVDAFVFGSTRQPNAEALGWLFVGTRGSPLAGSSLETYRAIRNGSRTLDDLAAEGRLPVAVLRDGVAERVFAQVVTENYFTLLPVPPVAGRMLAPADENAPGVPVVISEKFWRVRFDANPALEVLPLSIGQRAVTIVGVVPTGFQGPGGLFEPDLWLPMASLTALNAPAYARQPSARWLTLIGRPAAGATPTAIAGEVGAIAASIAVPDTSDLTASEPAVRFVPLVDGHPEVQQMRPMALWVVGISMTIVMLVACFNVAGLSLARALERRRDVAVRASLGASPWRLIRAMLTESLLFAAIAGFSGLLLVRWSESLLGHFGVPAPIPQQLHIEVSVRLLATLGLLVLLAALLPVAVPAWQVWRRDQLAAMRTGGHGTAGAGQRPRRVFATIQVAGSMLFVVLGLLLIQDFVRTLTFDPGFDPDRIAVLELSPALGGYTPETVGPFVRRVIDRLDDDPAIDAVGVADRLSFYVGYPDLRAVAAGEATCAPADCPTVARYRVSGGYFAAMGLALRAGRTFDSESPADADAVVVSQAMAERFWPAGAVGQTFRDGPERRLRTVIGVAPDYTHRGFNEAALSAFFEPLPLSDSPASFVIVVRSAGTADSVKPVLVGTLRAIDPDLPPSRVQTMRERMALPMWYPRVLAGFFGTCGVLAMFLATIGLVGATWYGVSRRTREFGLRLAVGATSRDLLRLVIGEGLRLALPGLAIGLAAAITIARLGRQAFPSVSADDPWSYVAAAAIQVTAVVAGNVWPARRAAATDPMRALAQDQ